MHELGITRNIVAIVTEAAHGRKIGVVTLEIGEFAGVMSDAIAFCFDAITEGTTLEGARLDIVKIPARARCTCCDAVFGAATLAAVCACGSRRVAWLSGQELNIKSMKYLETA
jgi:hydrogenase nickel incorporation protein HypA/HybF